MYDIQEENKKEFSKFKKIISNKKKIFYYFGSAFNYVSNELKFREEKIKNSYVLDLQNK